METRGTPRASSPRIAPRILPSSPLCADPEGRGHSRARAAPIALAGALALTDDEPMGDPSHAATRSLVEARMDGDPRPDPRLVAHRLGITIVSAPPRSILGGVAQIGRLGPGYLIRRARGLPVPQLIFAIAHELGHIAVRRFGLRVDHEEAWANRFAGALLVPREPLTEAWARGGDVADALACWPSVPPTCIALRIGEAGLAETIVVQAGETRYARTEREPSQEAVRVGVQAARRGRAARSGIAKGWRMTDAPRRAAVVLECA